jgi:uncharacterized membrane protein
MAPYFNNSADKKIRIMSALCYLSWGIIGLIYILLNGKNNQSQFFRYHFMQGILIGIFVMLVGWTGNFLQVNIAAILGLFGDSLHQATGMILIGLGWIVEILKVVATIAMIYGTVQSLRGKFADMPIVSKITRTNLR